jgi:hypothetical protein
MSGMPATNKRRHISAPAQPLRARPAKMNRTQEAIRPLTFGPNHPCLACGDEDKSGDWTIAKLLSRKVALAARPDPCHLGNCCASRASALGGKEQLAREWT